MPLSIFFTYCAPAALRSSGGAFSLILRCQRPPLQSNIVSNGRVIVGTRRGRDGRLTPTGRREIDRFTENWERRPNPISLPLPLVESTGTVHECEPAPVRVLMPMMVSYTMSEEMPARVVAWTNRAVKVQATLPDGRQVDAWVWANAVRRVDDQVEEA